MALKEEICITHVLREMKQGRTTPYLCKDDEDRQHIVKGENATIAGLVREWICAVIGTEFGLPIQIFQSRGLTLHSKGKEIYLNTILLLVLLKISKM